MCLSHSHCAATLNWGHVCNKERVFLARMMLYNFQSEYILCFASLHGNALPARIDLYDHTHIDIATIKILHGRCTYYLQNSMLHPCTLRKSFPTFVHTCLAAAQAKGRQGQSGTWHAHHISRGRALGVLFCFSQFARDSANMMKMFFP